MDSFIKAASGELGPYFGELLHEIFTGGPPITLSVKEDQIWKIMRLIFARGKKRNTITNAALLSALNELLLVMMCSSLAIYVQSLIIHKLKRESI